MHRKLTSGYIICDKTSLIKYHQWLSGIKLVQVSAWFMVLVPELTSVSLLDSESGFEIVTQLADTEK